MTNLLQSIFPVCFFLFSFTVAGEDGIYAQVGDTVQLQPPPYPNRYFYWYFGGKQIASLNSFDKQDITAAEWENRLTLTRKMLQIKNITRQDFGRFTCDVKDSLNKIITTKSYHVTKLIVAVKSRILLPGEPLSLTCNVETDLPKPEIYWLSPQGNKVEGKGGTFTGPASTSDSGQWTCVVSNNKVTGAKIDVAVIDLLPSAAVHTQYSSKSSPLSIPCSLPTDISWDHLKAKGVQEVGWYFCPNSATNPLCKISPLFSLALGDEPTWKPLKVGMLQPVLKPGTGNLSLVAKLGRDVNGGQYECLVKFKNDVILNRTVHVELLQITASPGTDLINGQQLNLTCTTGRPLPSDLWVKWFPPKEASLYPLAHDHQSAHLTVPEVGRGDKGTWRCELWRADTPLTSAAVALNIEPKISVWLLVTLCGATVILVLLMILVFMLHRRRTRRIRRHKLKHRLCRCKNPKPKGFYRS